MTTLLTGDLHLNDLPRDDYRFQFLDVVLPKLLKKQRVDTLLLLGDLTEEKDRHSAGLVNRIADALARLREQAQVIWLLGNHDYVDRAQPFFRAIAALAGVDAVTEPTRRESLSAVKSRGWGPVWLLPHTRDWQKDWHKLKFDKDATYFAHQTFQGAKAEHGKALDGIPTSVFPQGARCFSGDVHVPQKLGPVTYVGAPYGVDFGDSYRPRVIVLDDDGREKSVGVSAPGKVLLEVDSVKDLDVGVLFDGDVVKVRVNLSAKDYQKWPDIRQQVLDWGRKHAVNVHVVQPNMEMPKVNQRIRDTGQSDEDLLEEYAKHRGIDASTLNTGRLLMEDEDHE